MAKVDLKKLSIKELQELVTEAQELINEKKQVERDEAVAAIKALAIEKGFDLSELIPQKRGVEARVRSERADAGKSAPIKYRDDKGNKWSGRGVTPKWITESGGVVLFKDPV